MDIIYNRKIYLNKRSFICQTKKISKKKIEQYEKILKLLNDGEWHKTAEIADNLGLKDTRTKELVKELIALDKLIDNGKTKGKSYRLK